MRAFAFFLGLALFLGSLTWAADKHGGHEVEVGKDHVELMVRARDLTLYVRDENDKPIDPKTVKASANLVSGKDKDVIGFAPAGAEMLRPRAAFTVRNDAKVIVSVAGARSEQARFSLAQKQEHKGHKH